MITMFIKNISVAKMLLKYNKSYSTCFCKHSVAIVDEKNGNVEPRATLKTVEWRPAMELSSQKVPNLIQLAEVELTTTVEEQNAVEVLHVEPGPVQREVEIITLDKTAEDSSECKILKVVPGKSKKRKRSGDFDVQIIDVQRPGADSNFAKEVEVATSSQKDIESCASTTKGEINVIDLCKLFREIILPNSILLYILKIYFSNGPVS